MEVEGGKVMDLAPGRKLETITLSPGRVHPPLTPCLLEAVSGRLAVLENRII